VERVAGSRLSDYYNTMFQRLNENKDLLIVAIASFFIGFGAASFFGGNAQKDTGLAQDTKKIEDTTLPPLPFNKDTVGNGNQAVTINETVKPSGTNAFVVENQRAGDSVLVKKAEFSEARWIVVREINDDATVGNILGAGWFSAGAHENISVSLRRGTIGGEQYKAELFSDSNGDRQFDHKIDEPLKDAAGNTISVSFSTVASASGE